MLINYQPMVEDYFLSNNLINDFSIENFKTLTSWDANLITLLFHNNSGITEYSCSEASELLNINESTMKNFFVVHCCLSNYLYELIGEKKYSTWSIRENKLNVTYENGSVELFNVNNVISLMSKTGKPDWTYDVLVNELIELG